MDEELSKYIFLPYIIEVVPEACTDGSMCYRSSHPELFGCMSHGDTPEEAIENLSEARELYLRTLLEKGEHIPLPSPKVKWDMLSSHHTITMTGQEKRVWAVVDLLPDNDSSPFQYSLPFDRPTISNL